MHDRGAPGRGAVGPRLEVVEGQLPPERRARAQRRDERHLPVAAPPDPVDRHAMVTGCGLLTAVDAVRAGKGGHRMQSVRRVVAGDAADHVVSPCLPVPGAEASTASTRSAGPSRDAASWLSTQSVAEQVVPQVLARTIHPGLQIDVVSMDVADGGHRGFAATGGDPGVQLVEGRVRAPVVVDHRPDGRGDVEGLQPLQIVRLTSAARPARAQAARTGTPTRPVAPRADRPGRPELGGPARQGLDGGASRGHGAGASGGGEWWMLRSVMALLTGAPGRGSAQQSRPTGGVSRPADDQVDRAWPSVDRDDVRVGQVDRVGPIDRVTRRGRATRTHTSAGGPRRDGTSTSVLTAPRSPTAPSEAPPEHGDGEAAHQHQQPQDRSQHVRAE